MKRSRSLVAIVKCAAAAAAIVELHVDMTAHVSCSVRRVKLNGH